MYGEKALPLLLFSGDFGETGRQKCVEAGEGARCFQWKWWCMMVSVVVAVMKKVKNRGEKKRKGNTFIFTLVFWSLLDIGSCCICSSVKSFFSDKVQGMLCRCNSSNKYRRLNPKLEKKMVEAIKKRASSEQNTFRSINSIIMRFPKFKEGLKNIKSVFEQYDEDSNGTIDHEELKKCLNKLQLHLTETEIEDLFQACDVDGNEGIQLNEFIVLLCLIYLLMEPSSSPHSTSKMGSPELEATFDTIVEAFLFLDKNGDGKLNKEEMVMALNEASPWEKSPGRISRTRFKEMDWSNSGKVSFKEFLFALTNWVGIDTDDEKEHML